MITGDGSQSLKENMVKEKEQGLLVAEAALVLDLGWISFLKRRE